MKNRKKVIGITFATLAVLASVFYGYKYVPVFANSSIKVKGTLQSPEIKVTAQTAGVIKQLFANKGTIVNKNQDMAKIENLELENSVFKAEAQLEVAQAKLKQISSGTKPEEKAVLVARVNGQQTVIDGLQRTSVETKQVLVKVQLNSNDISATIIEHLAHLDKIASEHAGHQNQPAHVHNPQSDGQTGASTDAGTSSNSTTDTSAGMGMDCSQLLASVSSINELFSKMSQVGIGTDKLDLRTGATLLQAQTGLLQTQIANIENQLVQAKKELTIAKAELNAANAAPRQEEVDVAHAQVQEAMVNLQVAKRELARNTIASPVNGFVVLSEINLEQYVQPGTVAFTMADLDNMWVEVEVSPTVTQLQLGSKVIITAQQLPNKQFLGRVTDVTTSLRGSGSTVKIRVDNTENLLKPGQEIQVQF